MDACQGAGYEASGYDLPVLDIVRMDGREVEDCDWVVNCAAYTKVDMAETEPTEAFSVNAIGAGRVARMCRERGMKLIHISTDYVFDGQSRVAYREGDQTNPLNTYGMSKFIGEVLALKECKQTCVVRTQSLFSGYGVSFAKTILKKIKEGQKEFKVVDDQVSCPTHVVHLACALVRVMQAEEKGKDIYGILNISASDACSWYEFARTIVAIVKSGACAEVKPIKSDELPKTSALRPAFSVLCKDRFFDLTGLEMPGWRDGLNLFLRSEII